MGKERLGDDAEGIEGRLGQRVAFKTAIHALLLYS